MIFKNLDGDISNDYSPSEEDLALRSAVRDAAVNLLPREFEELSFSVGIEEWLRAVFACNQYVDTQAPWALRKTDPKRMEAVLLTLYIAIRDLALAIQPVVPSKAKAVLDMLGVAEDRRGFGDLADESLSLIHIWWLPGIESASPNPSFRASNCRKMRPPDACRQPLPPGI